MDILPLSNVTLLFTHNILTGRTFYAPPASDDVLKIRCCSCRKSMRCGLYRCVVQLARTACQILRYSLLLSQPTRSAPFTALTASETRTLPSGNPNRPRGPRRWPRVVSRRARYTSITSHHKCAFTALKARSRRRRRHKVCWNSAQMDKPAPKPDVLSTLWVDITNRSHGPRSVAPRPTFAMMKCVLPPLGYLLEV